MSTGSGFRRNGQNGDKPGKYELVARVHNSVTDPGGTVFIELFITGYGMIDAGKLGFYPPVEDLLSPESALIGGVDPNVTKTGIFTWGKGINKPIRSHGFTLQFDYVSATKEGKPIPIFFDAAGHGNTAEPVPVIYTENALGKNTIEGLPSEFNAPYLLQLKIRKKARPGIYYATVILTYFDGERWQTSTIQPSFTIRNIFQRNERWITLLGIIAALGSGSGLIPYLKPIGCQIVSLFTSLFK